MELVDDEGGMFELTNYPDGSVQLTYQAQSFSDYFIENSVETYVLLVKVNYYYTSV